MNRDQSGVPSTTQAGARHVGQPKQSVSIVLGVLWFLVGVQLAFGDVSSQIPNETCTRPLWATSLMGGLVVVASGIALWRTERWPHWRWLALIVGLVAAFWFVYLVIGPHTDLVCVN